MLCSRFTQILIKKPTLNNKTNSHSFITNRSIQKKCWSDTFLASFIRKKRDKFSMTSIRFLMKDFMLNRLWNVWSRNVSVVNTVRRLRRDRAVREVIHCFRQAFLRPRRTLVLSAAAAYHVNAQEPYKNPPCGNTITDNDLQSLLKDFDAVEDLSNRTLYCVKCKKRLVIEKQVPGIVYCTCEESTLPEPSEDGWVPYLEAEDVIIWRKEYKPGQGLYAYKVFGQYDDVLASDYAAVQVDGAYRRDWDSAVAALSVVERGANGVPDQTVLHWEVMWPRFFSNRDYVYIRRHKEFEIESKNVPIIDKNKHADVTIDIKEEIELEPQAKSETTIDKDVDKEVTIDTKKHIGEEERQSVHSNAKRKSLEAYEKEKSKPKLPWLKNYSCLSDLEKPKLPWYKDSEVDDTNSNSHVINNEKSVVNDENSVINDKQSGVNDKNSVVNEKSVVNSQNSTNNDKELGVNDKSSPNNDIKTVNNSKSSAINEKSVGNDKNITNNDKKSATNDKNSTNNDKKSIVNEKSVVKRTGVVKTVTANSESVNKAYVIVSRSCVHPKAPETKHAIRVNEYWSNMVVRSTGGDENLGMQFVLTYYDEPGTGGMPAGMAAWATGRAAPAYLARMRRAAREYRDRGMKADFLPFGPEKVSFDDGMDFGNLDDDSEVLQEPNTVYQDADHSDKSTQTDDVTVQFKFKIVEVKVVDDEQNNGKTEENSEKFINKNGEEVTSDKEEPEKSSDEDENSESWWKQMYPFYYFV